MLFINLDSLFTVAGGASDTDKVISRDDTTPIVVVVPGLTSDSFSSVRFLFYLF